MTFRKLNNSTSPAFITSEYDTNHLLHFFSAISRHLKFVQELPRDIQIT
ncbi:uncharacterized protein J3R85_005329 [Psidium guajava]|nr:uncharacterized protein J3R85_005329 [Psidium guajava]